MSKIIQIAAATAEGQKPLLYALDDAGDVWMFHFNEMKWKVLPSIDSINFSDAAEKLYRGSEVNVQPSKGKKKGR